MSISWCLFCVSLLYQTLQISATDEASESNITECKDTHPGALLLQKHIIQEHLTTISDLRMFFEECKDTHPAFLQGSDAINHWALMDCYSAWHTATLAKWAEEGSTSCEGRSGLFLYVDRGFGDAGHNLVANFVNALREGRMFLMKAPDSDSGTSRNIWDLAVNQRFDWSAKKNGRLLCRPEYEHGTGDAPDQPVRVGTPSGNSLLSTSTFGQTYESRAEVWQYLNRPIAEVMDSVNEVLSKVGPEDKLVAVHVRGQWAGGHFACGCKDLAELGQCASNIGPFLKSKGAPGFSTDGSNVKLFVASDAPAGIHAFVKAFGKEHILSLPDKMPIEHSLESSKEGAIRTLADFIILTRADALLGSCGSTFTSAANDFVGRDKNSFVLSGTDDSLTCARGGKDLDYSLFEFKHFTSVDYDGTCGCYAATDVKGGTCTVACHDALHKHPSLCDARWQKAASAIEMWKPKFRPTPSSATSLLAWEMDA